MKRFNVFQSLAVFFVFSLMVWGLVPSEVEGAVPQLINFQGILKDGSGNPVADGSYSVTFTVYDAPVGGAVHWAETTSVSTTDGLFSILLGSLNPVPESLFHNPSRYLGIKVATDPEMTPRQQLSSVGYSYVSSQWTSAGQNLFRLNGGVGIGTQSPQMLLHIRQTPLYGPGVRFTGNNNYDTEVGRTDFAWFGLTNPFIIQHLAGSGINDMVFTPVTNNPASGIVIKGNTGNVGIGNVNPTKKLEVAGSIKVGTNDTVFSSNVSSNSPLQLQAPAGTTRMFIDDATGNIGIGKTNPEAKLDVVGHAHIRPINGDPTKILVLDEFSGAMRVYSDANTGTPGDLILGTYPNGHSNQLVLKQSSANVGIGTTSPGAKLDVLNGNIRVGSQVTSAGIEFYPAIAGTPTNAGSIVGVGGSTNIAIMPVGNVGIGTTSPGAKLEIKGTGTLFNAIKISNDIASLPTLVRFGTMSSADAGIAIGDGDGVAQAVQIASGAPANTIVVRYTGNVGIGTASPANPLEMGSGAHVTAGGTWTNASSRSYKTDIHSLKDKEYFDILEKLEKVDVVRFKYKKDPGREHIGLIAEDVPDEIASDDRTGVPTADAIAFLMAALKAQQTKIQELEEKVDQLNKENHSR